MLLDQVRPACREASRRAEHVRVVARRLPAYAAELEHHPMTLPELDPECHFLGQGDHTAAFILTLDAVNFGSGYFPCLRPFANREGYFAIAAALTARYRENGPPTAAELAELTAEDTAQLFGQNLDHPHAAELMHHFAEALRQLGSYLLTNFDGRFTALIEAAEGSAARLVDLLVEIPFYRDIAPYQELTVPFLKRAQLTAADLSLAFGGRGTGLFRDFHRLTSFADNLIPHVLRTDGLLEYTRDLACRIDSGMVLPAGSPEEIEIRACALDTVEDLVAELHRRGRDVTAVQLDYFLWNRGQEPRYSSSSGHLTRTVFY